MELTAAGGMGSNARMAQVSLKSVSKVFGGSVKAVDDVSLEIADREFIVLVGPSGCGKSTTLRMVAGLEEISAGEIRIGDRVVNEVAPKDRDIAMVFQNYALYPHMTVYQNMAFALRLRRKHAAWHNPVARVLAPARYAEARSEHERIDQRVRQAAAMLNIDNLLHRKPKELSGGQRQRVAVGRAIVREPKAYLFDEPLSNLDAKLRVEMRGEIKRIHRRVQTTTIYVTHDQEEAMTLGDRVVVMKDGRIHQVAPPFEVYERPVNRFVAGFVGTPPMNFLNGRIVRDAGRLAFDDGHQRLGLCAAHAERLADRVDRTVVLGVRPDVFTPVAAAQPGVTVAAHVLVTEPLGDRVDIQLDVPAHGRMVCRTDPRHTVREGADVHMQVDMNRVHFFEPEADGRNLSLAGARS